MNARAINAVLTFMVAGLAIGLAGCDKPVGPDSAPAHLNGKVVARYPDESGDASDKVCNGLVVQVEDGTKYAVCTSNSDYDRSPIGSVFTR